MEPVEHVAPVHGAPCRDGFEDRPVDRPRAPRREDLSGALAGGREHFEPVAFDEHDGDPVERHEPAHFADERAESFFDDQGRPERAGATVRGLEHVDAAAERIPQLLGLRGTTLGDCALAFEAQHEPAHDQTDDDLAPHLEHHVVGMERLTRTVRAQTLELDQHRHGQDREHDRADDPEAHGCLDDGEVQNLADWAPAVEVVDQQVRGEHRRVERQRGHGEHQLPPP
jgi:hypothetical protein